MNPTLTWFSVLVISMFQAQELSNVSAQRINSAYDEQNPVISPDGTELYFTIGNHPANVGGKKDPGDIWVSRWIDNQWSVPVHGGPSLNNSGYNAVAGFASGGKQLFLHGHYAAAGVARTQGIAITKKNMQGWSHPENIVIPYFLNKSGIMSGMVSGDGTVFVFAAESYGTHGVDDIYVSLKRDGKWSEPKNLGSTINTKFQELCPSLSADGKTLYFSSNGRKGRGSFDIFSATRLDDSWTNWSAPTNLGSDINSEGRDLYYRHYPLLGFSLHTSTVNSDGYGDIKFYKSEQKYLTVDDTTTVVTLPKDTVEQIIETIPDTKPDDKLVKVYGNVMDSKTGEPIPAKVTFAAPGLGEAFTTSTADGYTISIPSTAQYNVSIEAQGYVSALQTLDMNTLEMRTLEMNFTLQPVAIGTTVNLKNVLFAQTKADILPESHPELDLVVNFLKDNPNVRIELSGHTDNRGIHADNVRLSQQRVNKVKEYLVSKGIDAKRISGKGYGGTRPIASNDTEEYRRMNRRVEFTIKKF